MKNYKKIFNWAHLPLAVAIASATMLGNAAAGDAKNPDVQPTGTQQEPSASRTGYVVGLKDLPLGLYEGGNKSFPAPKRLANGKLDLKSKDAESYLAYLVGQQDLFLAQAEQLLGRALKSPSSKYFRFQHAFNGMALSLTKDEAAQLSTLDAVALIQEDQVNSLQTDVSAEFIGANWIWDGIDFPIELRGHEGRGEGVVVGVLDSGINPASPSFSATDARGYTHSNPLGEGVYLGICDPESVFYDAANGGVCNSKLIGGYDFIDEDTIPGYDAPGIEDEEPYGHGSHTASTAAGNYRSDRIYGLPVNLSGIAPHANVVAYNVCFTSNVAGTGGCLGTASLAAVNQAVRDGAVDVLNYSIGSRASNPWEDPVAMAFLAAQNSGIFVAVSAGNTTTAGAPAQGSVLHMEPWVSTVGAITHNRRNITPDFSVTGPGKIPNALRRIPYDITEFGVSPISDIPADTPIAVSPGYLSNQYLRNDGCTAFPAGTFLREGVSTIAIVRNGGCTASTKARNARTAGASVVVIANNDIAHSYDLGTEALTFVGPPLPIPVLAISNSRGDAIRQFAIDTEGDVQTARISSPGWSQPEIPFAMGNFSLIGPASINTVKPDMVAPGVNVLAAQSRWTHDMTGGHVDETLNERIGMLSGTSMASPMVAGSAALIHQVHPSWTPTEIKSALMLSALISVGKSDRSATPATIFEQGAGAINLVDTAHLGFVLNESSANYRMANPATGGNVNTLNIPSYQNLSCRPSCTFTRRLKNVSAANVRWHVAMEGNIPRMSVMIAPTDFTLGPSNPEQVVTVTFNTAPEYFATGPNYFGDLLFTVPATGYQDLRMPIVLRKPSAP